MSMAGSWRPRFTTLFIHACVAVLASVTAAIAISYLIVFKHAPENLFDTLCWVTLAHIGVSVMFRPKLVFGSWLACVIGMVFAVGAFT